ncbi:flavin reductase family protein [Micromonospora sp. RTGN7]|uniref:flavin reductase family protein n=1 Tax=Micromonospora sp. RTGN7 TaxID=3016526 RepID=UPI0029FF5657|nr:flavin reductase family protein [Micromonospora sp. RTGN7]
MNPSATATDPTEFRRVLGHFATGVTTVTAVDPTSQLPVGLTVNSFVSVSLHPPLVSFCVSNGSGSWPAIRSAERLCINILGVGQQGICHRMAAAVEDRFRGLDWQLSPGGAPVLDGVVAWIEGSVEAEHEAGDHMIVVVRVHHLHGGVDGRPLVFHRGRYGGFVA